jgi:hypothetical protein
MDLPCDCFGEAELNEFEIHKCLVGGVVNTSLGSPIDSFSFVPFVPTRSCALAKKCGSGGARVTKCPDWCSLEIKRSTESSCLSSFDSSFCLWGDKELLVIGGHSATWRRAFVLNRRFEPQGSERILKDMIFVWGVREMLTMIVKTISLSMLNKARKKERL